MVAEAYPLYWPEGRPRTPRYHRERAKFDTSFARARDEIVRQVELMTGKYEWERKRANAILSTNVPLRRDGLPLANGKTPEDPGVAVYFTYKDRKVCFACDRWDRVEDNMQAIVKTIDALRGISRWGTGDMMEAAFRGFVALEHAATEHWSTTLGCARTATRADVEVAYRRARSRAHPDNGGTPEQFNAVERAWADALAVL